MAPDHFPSILRQKHAAGQYNQQSLTDSEYSLLSKQWGLYNEVD